MTDSLNYKQSGVDISAAEGALKSAKKRLKATHTGRVLGRYGAFSGLFDLKGLGQDPVLVASTDGVGTKLKLAFETGIHHTVGQDLVNHCVDDILCCGARPLFFLDYLGTGKLRGEVFNALVDGLAQACEENGVALLGGETAELPGMYHPGEYDLAGTIVGWVERDEIIDGSRIAPGDALVGLASTGLHTNGYSLARKALFEKAGLKADDFNEKLGMTVGEALMQVHRSYGPLIRPLVEKSSIKGLAHITGGGFEGNIPRVLPDSVSVEIRTDAWEIPPIFELIQSSGPVELEEMYRVFNMGIGMVVFLPEGEAGEFRSACESAGCPAFLIGSCVESDGESKVVF